MSLVRGKLKLRSGEFFGAVAFAIVTGALGVLCLSKSMD
jgi:hypothetical protein